MAIPKLYKGLDQIGNDYGAALVATYREAKVQAKDPSDIPFSKVRLVHHGNEILRLGISSRQVVVKNFPDALYSFRARVELPSEILRDGNFAIVGRGKGLYAFVKIPMSNRMRLPDSIPSTRVQDRIPAWARQYMSNDEQGMLTRIQINDLIAKYLGLNKSFRLQSHLRKGITNYGQVEIDELYVGQRGKQHVGIGVEAKNTPIDDCLNISQLFGLGRALMQEFPPTIPKHLIGAKPDTSGRICMVEFSIPNHPAQLTQIRDWVAYELI